MSNPAERMAIIAYSGNRVPEFATFCNLKMEIHLSREGVSDGEMGWGKYRSLMVRAPPGNRVRQVVTPLSYPSDPLSPTETPADMRLTENR